jgi:hypothetical protein
MGVIPMDGVAISPGTVWALIAAIAGGVILLGNAADKVVSIVRAFKAPNTHQDKRLDELEKWRMGVDAKLETDLHRLNALDEGNRVTQRALLALLSHGIDGNNIQQMEDARLALENHLINR